MSKRAYHHGNLKHELIDRGLEFIDQNGVESLYEADILRFGSCVCFQFLPIFLSNSIFS